MKLQVTSACQGRGRCYSLAPQYLESDDEGFVTIAGGDPIEIPEDDRELALELVGTCPESAIVVIDRKKNNHFGFASGPHRCLGMHLARREMAIAVQEWLSLIPHFELEGDVQLHERGGGAMMALETLPLRWEVNS